MANSNEIKQKITLSGEKEYSNALKTASRNLKTLQTSLKAETAELGKNATAQDKAKVKAESLKKQIAEQETVVKTLSTALEEVKEKYGDNEAEVARWEQRLNNARATLANMKNDLEGIGDGFAVAESGAADAVTATKSFADTLGNLDSIGSSVSDSIESIFTSVIDVVTDAVADLWELVSATAAKANNWTDIAGYWGTDAQTIQAYARATEASANSFEDLQSAVSKLVLGGNGKAITELIGISDVNYKDQWAYAMAVMGQLSEMTKSGADMTSIYEKIFGEKKATKVMDLINDWDTILEAINSGTYNGNESGYGMSDQELSTMNDLWAKINEVETKWNALKENFAAGFGVASMQLLVNVEGTLDGLAAYMNATNDSEKEAALAQIRANIEEFFRKVGEIINESIGILQEVGTSLQNSDDPVTSLIGKILASLADTLEWFVNNQDAVIGALEAIFGVFLLGKLTRVAAELAKIVASIETIKAFKNWKIPTDGTGGVGTGTGTGVTGGGFLSGVWSMLGNAATTLMSADPFGLTALIPSVLGDKTAAGREIRNGGSISDAIEAGKNEITGYFDDVKKRASTFFDDWGNLFSNVFGVDTTTAEAQAALGFQFTPEQIAAAQEYWDAFRNGEDGGSTLENLLDAIQDEDVLDELLNKIETLASINDTIEDLPLEWFSTLDSSSWNSGATGEDGITKTDLANFNSLPANVQTAVENGAKNGLSGVKVMMDGAAVGRLVADYVSTYIAGQVTTYAI